MDCPYWAEPETSSTSLHVAAEQGRDKALAWLLLWCSSHSHRVFDVRKLKNSFGESPVEICLRHKSEYPKCLEVMEAHLGAERSLSSEGEAGEEGGRGGGAVEVLMVRTYNKAFAWLVSKSPLVGDRNVPLSAPWPL